MPQTQVMSHFCLHTTDDLVNVKQDFWVLLKAGCNKNITLKIFFSWLKSWHTVDG